MKECRSEAEGGMTRVVVGREMGFGIVGMLGSGGLVLENLF